MLLLQAFDLTGRCLFGDLWQGTEAFARRLGDPTETRMERERLLDRIKMLGREARPHEELMAYGAGDTAHNEATSALNAIDAERNALKQELVDTPRVTESWVKGAEAYDRRRRVEGELQNAFRSEDLLLQTPTGQIVEWKSWVRHTDFTVYYGLSMIRLPTAYSSQRRAAALIDRAAFETWLTRFDPVDSSPAKLSTTARAEAWLQDAM